MDPWKSFELGEGEVLFRSIGPLRIWMRRSGNEVHICSRELPEELPPAQDIVQELPAEDAVWHRWAVDPEQAALRLQPVMPDRPVVVRPESALSLSRQAQDVFYARIPFVVAVLSGEDTVLYEIPARTLSNTWFGPDTTRGELCYGMQTTARRSLEGVEPAPHRAICPIAVKNVSDDLFHLERFCIRAEHLSLFAWRGQLWTSRIGVTVRGEKKPELVSYDDDWFGDEEPAELLSAMRQPARETLVQRSMGGLKSLVGGV